MQYLLESSTSASVDMALILLFKVMVALSVLLWYGAAVLRFINEYFHSQFRKQLELQYREHPEMRNLDLDGFRDVVTQFPRDDNSIADSKSDIFVVDSISDIKQQQQRLLPSQISLEKRTVGKDRDIFDNLDGRNNDGGESIRKYNIKEVERVGGGIAEGEYAFSGFESSDPDHYYSILRSSQSGGHGRDQKPQSDFTAATTTTHTNTEWVSMSLSSSRSGQRESKHNNAASAGFPGFTSKDAQEEADYHQNFYPTTRDDDYNEEYDVDAGADHEGNTDHSSCKDCGPSESVFCKSRSTTSSADLSAEYDPNIQWNDDGYYCSAAAGESKVVTNHLESDYYYYYGKDFRTYPSADDDIYAEFHKYVLEEKQLQMPLKREEGENHYRYYEDSPSPTEVNDAASTFYHKGMESSFSMSKSSFSFLIFLLPALLVV